MSIFDLFKPKSVINTDSYDRRTYGQLRKESIRLAELEQKGSEQLPTFPHLMGDIWAGLYKNTPRLKPLDEVPEEVKPNAPIMKKVFGHQEFTSLREHTKLDELASALGVVHMGEKIDDLLKDVLPEEVKKQLQDLAKQQSQAQKAQDKAEALKDALEYLKHKKGVSEKRDELKKQLSSAKRKVTSAQKKANQIADKASQAIEQALDTPGGQTALGDAILQVQQEVKGDTQAIAAFLGGLGAGKQPGEKINMNPATAVQLAQMIRNSYKLKRIAELAGRMKQIAQKKQKSKTRDTIERTDVSMGNEASRLLPQELALLSKGETRQDFLRRYAEGKLLEYSPEAKERLGKGPIVCCLDTSGSMKNLDPESKAVMLALMGIARKQKRAFSLINFSSPGQQKCWEFPNPKDITPEQIVEMAEFFYNGGTDFMNPLDLAIGVIKKSKFKKADVIFITDGDALVNSSWLKTFLKNKKEKKFQVISVQLGDKSANTLKEFSDKVIKADSLFDDAVTNAVLAV